MNPEAALKALAEPHRRAILQVVAGGARSVGEIASHFDITQQAVSRHLRVLRDAGLVEDRHEGTRHLFAVDPEGFAAVQEFLDDFWSTHLARLKSTAEGGRRGRSRG